MAKYYPKEPEGGYKKPNRYQKFIFPRALPDIWDAQYRMLLSRLRKYYVKGKTEASPLYMTIIKRIAAMSIRLEYLESEDFYVRTAIDINSPEYVKSYMEFINLLNKTLEQLMKYTEPKTTLKQRTVTKDGQGRTEIQELTTTQIYSQIRELVGSAEEEIIDIDGRVKDETAQLESGKEGQAFYREIPVYPFEDSEAGEVPPK